MPEPIKRLRYFTGQFLEASDFVTEQNYHLDMRRRGNRGLYLAGILDGGFVVKYLPNEKKVEISAGVAVDAQGRELVVVTSVKESPPQTGIHFLTLNYQEQETDTQTQTGEGAVSDTTRYDETPKVGFFKDGTSFDKDTYIVLAKITVDNAGNVSGIDTSVRQHASGRFPSSLTVAGNVGIGTANPIAGLEIDKGGTNDVALLLNSSGPGWGSGLQLKNTAQGGKSYGIYSGFGSLHFADVDASVDRLLIHSSGNVGIGTTEPKATFDVNGSTLLGYETTLTQIGLPAADFGAPLKSGFYQNGGSKITGDVPDSSHSWTHLIAARHSNTGNNHQLQIASSYGSNDKLYFRKIAAPGTSNPPWNELATRGANQFVGSQSISGTNTLEFGVGVAGKEGNAGKIGYGTFDPQALCIVGAGTSGSDRKITMWAEGGITVRGKLQVSEGGILNGVAIGVDPSPVPGAGDITFPYPYETIGTTDPRFNLRLHSNNSIAFHTGNAQGPKATINGDGHMVINGNIGTSSQSPTDGLPNGWGGGVHTWDLVAEGSVWAAHYVYCQDAQIKKRDLAENYISESALEPGDVVCLDPKEDRIVKSERANDGLLLGVISTSPGLLLGAEHSEDDQCTAQERLYPVALSGRVPCKVTDENGSISRGDFLTSSLTPGCAMKAAPVIVGGVEIYAPGTIIGKALEPFTVGTGVIEVFVTLK